LKLTRNAQQKLEDDHIATSDAAISEFSMGSLVEEVVDAVLEGERYRQGISFNQEDARYHSQSQQETLQSSEFADRPLVLLSIDKSSNQRVRSESGAWRRILMNLFSNSLKYCKSGYIEVGVCAELVKDDDEHLKVTLVVKDTGKGISQHYLQRSLFRPFAQETLSPRAPDWG
jgi:signal transduction histidine kinase